MRIFPPLLRSHSPSAPQSPAAAASAQAEAAAAAEAEAKVNFRLGLFRKFTVDSEDSAREIEESEGGASYAIFGLLTIPLYCCCCCCCTWGTLLSLSLFSSLLFLFWAARPAAQGQKFS